MSTASSPRAEPWRRYVSSDGKDGADGDVSPGAVKLGELTAMKIEEQIAARGWPLGEVIGSEADLLSEYGVSRSVLREAIRLLEHHGVATMRRGPGGGLVTRHPDPAGAVRPVQLFLEFAHVSPRQLIQVRIALETLAVRQATENLTEKGAEQLRHCVSSEKELMDEDDFDLAIHDLHIVIADLSGNPALRLFIDVLTRLTHTDTPGIPLYVPGSRARAPKSAVDEVHRSHVAIAEAIITGDSALASRRMIKHLEATRAYLNDVDR